jgi:hypothetical protein
MGLRASQRGLLRLVYWIKRAFHLIIAIVLDFFVLCLELIPGVHLRRERVRRGEEPMTLDDLQRAWGIVFYTMRGQPLVTGRGTGTLQPMERALDDIRRSGMFASTLPTPIRGPYKGIPMGEILENCQPVDLERFLRFVHTAPDEYLADNEDHQSVKIAEAFATWAYNGAPTRTK